MKSASLSRYRTHSSAKWLMSTAGGIACIGILWLVLAWQLCPIGLRAGTENNVASTSQNDRGFSAVVAAIAERRRANRSTAIDVTDLFKPMTDRLSLTELEGYVASRYAHGRAPMQGKNVEWVDIGENELKTYSMEFLYKDVVTITFTYDAAWQTVTQFQAVLFNDQL